ncbi:MAG TPA: UDP-N-acetylmuramoyl-L-alanyl-D-glutamate--2,6-diaminopimelate ligase [Egibacteraceae bacterium]|nr:UDP-N-acetylmuramoyl-L-alanyl-D-glutamate--2,6-diaminopimelate ligase [Egibacteraceae bacterium]
MSLRDLFPVLPEGSRLHGPQVSPSIADVTHDSRAAGPGVLFACRPGQRVDGHAFAPAAVAAGSPALLAERELALEVPQLITESVTAALGPVAAAVHGQPSQAMTLCGVTGTNGKTTTAFLLESILRAAGHVTGLVGTVHTRIAGDVIPGVRTTPEATDLQRLLRRMRKAGVTGCAMEVSSHGLALGRVAGTRFAVAAFTNLTQDHLDFHADLEDYFAAKARLFQADLSARGVINVDDPYGRRLAASAPIEILRVSASGQQPADATARDVRCTPEGSVFIAEIAGVRTDVRTLLPGRFNVDNALCALAAATAVGIDLPIAAAGVAALPGVPGRMQRVDVGQPFTVLVDYAHTPDSLTHVLAGARDLSPTGRVLVVIGCGGDRDRAKRPLMGAAAARFADRAVLTSDNPRSEDPLAILEAVAAGARASGGDWQIQPDRRAAIGLALAEARPGDVVVIAGKGHEAYQELADQTVVFDDVEVAREWLEAADRSGAGS